MPTKVDIRVGAGLHPDNVKEVDGYDDDTAAVLAPTMSAFDEAYQGIAKVHDARAAAAKNPTWNEAQQIIMTQEMADKVFARIARAMDGTRANLVKGIDSIEKQLSSPLESKAAQSVSAEIRSFVRDLPSEKRHTFIRKAIEQGDAISASALLGAPPYLSGLDAQFQAIYTRLWNEKASPDVAKRLKVMIGAKELIEERAGLVHSQLEKAVGMRPDKVRMLREARNAAEQAFILKESA